MDTGLFPSLAIMKNAMNIYVQIFVHVLKPVFNSVYIPWSRNARVFGNTKLFEEMLLFP